MCAEELPTGSCFNQPRSGLTGSFATKSFGNNPDQSLPATDAPEDPAQKPESNQIAPGKLRCLVALATVQAEVRGKDELQ